MNSFSLRACAKINLGLEVLDRRPDGFHNIQSIFLAVDLHDTLEISESDAPEVICIPPVTANATDNLVSKAIALYTTMFPQEIRTAKITVHKRIPTGGGLGGGSSDAAAALLGMALLNGHHISDSTRARLKPLAEQLGSDVPFFLRAGIALVEGRGESITPLHIDLPWVVLLICPGIKIDTSQAYSTLGITRGELKGELVESLTQVLDNKGYLRDLFINNFEPTVFVQHPLLATIKHDLYEQSAVYASMSGSGSTVYGLFTNVDNAEKARSAFSSMDTYICHPVNASFLRP